MTSGDMITSFIERVPSGAWVALMVANIGLTITT